MIEIPDHPFFVASQFHPELKSRPDDPHPLFVGLMAAAAERSRRTSDDPVEATETVDTRA
jgi:CTP synthase